MSNEIDDGGPAFPGEETVLNAFGIASVSFTSGMSLQDYFAAAALTGLLADHTNGPASAYALDAYNLADAMLAERAKRRDGGS